MSTTPPEPGDGEFQIRDERDPDQQVLQVTIPVGTRGQLLAAGFPLENFDFGHIEVEVRDIDTDDLLGWLDLNRNGDVRYTPSVSPAGGESEEKA